MLRRIAAPLLVVLIAMPVFAQSVTLPSFGPPAPKPAPKPAPAPPAKVQTPPAQEQKEQKWMGITAPPAHGTYKWALQSVAVRVDGKTKFSSFYYEATTGRSVGTPLLPLPGGGSIVGVFPDDCTFRVEDQAGHSFTFKDAKEAKGKSLAAGSWSLFPLKCGGVALFVK